MIRKILIRLWNIWGYVYPIFVGLVYLSTLWDMYSVHLPWGELGLVAIGGMAYTGLVWKWGATVRNRK